MEFCLVRVFQPTLYLFGRCLCILGLQGFLAWVVCLHGIQGPLQSFLGREVLEEIQEAFRCVCCDFVNAWDNDTVNFADDFSLASEGLCCIHLRCAVLSNGHFGAVAYNSLDI